MKKAKTKTYYVVTHDGEPVVYGDKIPLFLRKKDASPLKGDVIEKMRLVRAAKKGLR
jgi:hypothetical protein